MSIKRIGYGMPQSSAGILGVSANENMEGLKLDPRAMIVFSAIFIVAVIVVQKAFVH